MAIKKFGHSGGGTSNDVASNRSTAKTSKFRIKAVERTTRFRTSGLNALLSANPQIKNMSDLMRVVKEQLEKPAGQRIAAFNSSILTEATGSPTRTDYFKTEGKPGVHKTSRMIARSGGASDASGRRDLDAVMNPKAPEYKKRALTKKLKK